MPEAPLRQSPKLPQLLQLPQLPQAVPSSRVFVLDALKAAGCVLIVLHHLAFYGPMADAVATAWPALIDALAQHARLAVQAFLVCSGFLTAQAMHTAPAQTGRAVLRAFGRRYLRLALPLLLALAFTLVVSEAIRPAFDHPSLSEVPQALQVLAHVFFVQHLLGVPALSAGVWYVAIDLQLYAACLLIGWAALRGSPPSAELARRRTAWITAAVGGLTVLSLLWWSHVDALEDTAVYFFGSYGLGWLAWQGRRVAGLGRTAAVLALALLCLWCDARGRALTAAGVAMLLVYAPQAWMALAGAAPGHPLPWWQRAVLGLSRVSYAVFVVHFGVSLCVNAGVHGAWPASVWANALGMALALGLSWGAGHWLHAVTERAPATWRRWAVVTAVLAAATAVAMCMGGWPAA